MQAATKVTQRTAVGVSGAPVAVIACSGAIASTSRDAILAAYHGVGADVHKVLLDFSGAEYINSSGIAIIIQLLLEGSKSAGRTIGIFGLSRHFTKVFTMVGVTKYAQLSADETMALAQL